MIRRCIRHLYTAAAVISLSLSFAPRATGQEPAGLRPARITGVVIADDTNRPLEASVRLLGGSAPRSAHTDDAGAFDIEAPPGSYLITAVTSGYIVGTAGQRTPSDRSTLFDLVSGQSRHVEIRLVPLGRIAGTIVDAEGRPAMGIEVHASRAPSWGCATASGAPLPPAQCDVTGRAVTDANGRFQIDGLRTGSYQVMAVRSARTDAPANASALAAPPGPLVTYFPGTPFPEQATAISVTPAIQAEATFALVESPLARVAGVVVDSSGQPARNTVVMLIARRPQPFSPVPRHALLEPGGRFELTDVPPGDYVLAVRDTAKFVAIAERGSTAAPFTGELADFHIRVPSEPVDDLRIVTRSGFDLSGTVIVDGRPARNLARASVAGSAGGDVGALIMSGGAAAVAEDGTFVLRNLIGPQRILVTPPAGLSVQRIVAGGVDITDEGVEMSRHVSLDVVLGPPTSLAGRVTTSRGTAVPGMSVVAFADDPRLRVLPHTRHVRVVSAALDGTFRIDGLPAGRYYVAAVPSTTEGRPTDVDALEPLIPRASRVELRDGESTSAVVRID